jgi:hypothetical protein
MTLTHADYQILSRPFEPSEHEFREGSGKAMLCYITEEAITPRIIEVDPAFELTEPMVIQDKPDNISIKIGITIKGITRWGIGTSELKTFTGEPTKSAVTDAFKRAARMFGIGLYLQGLKSAKWVKDEETLAGWLRGLNPPAQRKPAIVTNIQDSASGKEQYGQSTLQVYTKETAEKDKRYMTISGATLWSREPFRALGFDEHVIEQLGQVGEHILPHSVTACYVQQGVYKNLIRLRRDDTGEVVDKDGNAIAQAS